jgi:hypothetical protein
MRFSSLILFFIPIKIFAQQSKLQLHGLYEPPPVEFRFETPGWYIMAGVLLTAIIMTLFFRIRKYIKNLYRREALKELAALNNSKIAVPEIFMILKKTAMYAFGREHVGALYGKAWLTFLDKTGENVQLTNYHEQISSAVYNEKALDPEIQKIIISNAKNWIRTHAG